MQPVSFAASDGFVLRGVLYGDARSARGAVLIAAAMGVAQSYYADFAQWLARQGHIVLSFDYRGMGQSRPARFSRSLRGFQADVHTWAERDAAAALAFLDAQVAAWVTARPDGSLGRRAGMA